MIEDVLPSTKTGRKSYRSLKHLIKTQVKAGDLLAHQRLPGMRTLRDKYGMSLATVQRALAELCNESVLYSQTGNGTFVAPVHRETKHIGMLCGMGINMLEDSMYSSLMKVIQTKALVDDKMVTLFQAKKKNNGQYSYFDTQSIIRHEVDVLILVNVVNLGLVVSLKQLGIPIIVTDLDATDIGVHSVYFDNESSSYDMTRKLADDGHKEIWFIGGLEQTDSRFDLCRRQRYTGWRLGCRSKDIPARVDLYLKRFGNFDTLKERVERALQNNPAPTAIVAEDADTVKRVFESIGIAVEVATWIGNPEYQNMLSSLRYLAPCDFAKLGHESYDLLRRIDEGAQLGMARRVIESQIIDCKKSCNLSPV